MLRCEFGEVVRRVAILHHEVGFLGEEGEVCDQVSLCLGKALLLKERLGENMVQFEAAEVAQKVARQLETRPPVPGFPDPSEHIEKGVEAGTLRCASEVVSTNGYVTARLAKLSN